MQDYKLQRSNGHARVMIGLLGVAAGLPFAEVSMADEDKPRIILVTTPKRVDTPTKPSALRPKQMPPRSEEQLRTLALRIAENSELMQRFRLAFGSNDKVLTGRSMHEIREYAQSLDPSITFSEGTRLVLVLMNTHGSVKD